MYFFKYSQLFYFIFGQLKFFKNKKKDFDVIKLLMLFWISSITWMKYNVYVPNGWMNEWMNHSQINANLEKQ